MHQIVTKTAVNGTRVMEQRPFEKRESAKSQKNSVLFLMAMAVWSLAFPMSAFAAIGSGTSGDPWQIADTQDGGSASRVTAYRSGSTLYINGNGNMEDFWFSPDGDAPWYSVRANIQTVRIADGVTNIGDVAFRDCNNLTSVTIPSTVTIIGKRAFEGCTSLKAITIPNTVNTVEYAAFKNAGLTSVTIADGSNAMNWNFYKNYDIFGDILCSVNN